MGTDHKRGTELQLIVVYLYRGLLFYDKLSCADPLATLFLFFIITVNQNNIGAPKKQNNFGANKLLIFPIILSLLVKLSLLLEVGKP